MLILVKNHINQHVHIRELRNPPKKRKQDLDIKEQYKNLGQIRHKMTRKDKCKRNNDKHVVKIPSKDIADGDKLYPYT